MTAPKDTHEGLLEKAKDALFNIARTHGYKLNDVELGEAVRAVTRAIGWSAGVAQAPLRAALSRRSYAMSEPHLTGWRLIIGFDNLPDLQVALEAVALLNPLEQKQLASALSSTNRGTP